jgi:hypothetical protein
VGVAESGNSAKSCSGCIGGEAVDRGDRGLVIGVITADAPRG